MQEDDVEAMLNEVSPVGDDSSDCMDADGDSTVVIVLFKDTGVFGCCGCPPYDALDSAACA